MRTPGERGSCTLGRTAHTGVQSQGQVAGDGQRPMGHARRGLANILQTLDRQSFFILQ